MKKIITLVLTIALSVNMLCACGQEKKEEVTTKKATISTKGVKLIKKGTISVGSELGYPPFEQVGKDGKTPEGFDIDLINEIASRLGLKVEIINTSFDGIFAGLDKNYDIVCSAVTVTPDRKKNMLFTEPYIDQYQSVVVKKDSKLKVNSFKDLTKKTISVQKGTTSDALMTELKSTKTVDVDIVENEKINNCFTQIKNGEVDAIVVDSTVASSFIDREPENYKIAYVDKKELEQFAIAVSKKNPKLKEAIDKAIIEMKKDKTIDDTINYWFGEE